MRLSRRPHKIERQQRLAKGVVFRVDPAFAKPELYEALEVRNVKHAIRPPANETLERNISGLLTRPGGRLSFKPAARLERFLYQAATWPTPRRVAAKVEFRAEDLFPRVDFIVHQPQAACRLASGRPDGYGGTGDPQGWRSFATRLRI